MTTQLITQKSAKISAIFKKKVLPLIPSVQYALVYLSTQSEVRTTKIINQLLNCGIQVLVPSVKNKRMIAVRYSRGCVLKKGAFRINEPADIIKFTKIKKIGLVIVPGIAFDRLGRRIGFGKGFYDIFLSKLPKTTIKIGMAFEHQIVPVIKHEEHDIHMNYILTEEGLIHAG